MGWRIDASMVERKAVLRKVRSGRAWFVPERRWSACPVSPADKGTSAPAPCADNPRMRTAARRECSRERMTESTMSRLAPQSKGIGIQGEIEDPYLVVFRKIRAGHHLPGQEDVNGNLASGFLVGGITPTKVPEPPLEPRNHRAEGSRFAGALHFLFLKLAQTFEEGVVFLRSRRSCRQK